MGDAAGYSFRREVLMACKRYDCTVCGRGRRRRIANHLDAAVDAADAAALRLRFLTFTYPNETPAEVGNRGHVLATSERFRRVVQELRRHGVTFEYGRVLEATKRDRVHVHALVWGDFIPKCTPAGRRKRGLPTRGKRPPCYCSETDPCVQRLAWDQGFGFVDVRRVSSRAEAVGYVLKYLGKQLERSRWPKHARRYAYSRAFAAGVTLGELDRRWLAPFLAAEAERLEVWFGRTLPMVWWEQGPYRAPWELRPWEAFADLTHARLCGRPPPRASRDRPIPWPPRPRRR